MAGRTSNTHAHVKGALETTYGDLSGLTPGFDFPLAPGDGFRRVRERLPNDGLPGVGMNASAGVRQHAEGTLSARVDYDTMSLLFAAFAHNTENEVLTSGASYANYFFPRVALNSVFWNQFLGDVESDVVGSVCTAWSLEMSNDEPLRFNSTWMCKDIDAFTEISAQPGYDATDQVAPIKPSQMTNLTIGSITFVDSTTHLVSGMTIDVDQGVPADDYGFGVSALSKPVRRNKMSVNITLELPIWEDEFWNISGSPNSGILPQFLNDGVTRAVTMTWNNGASGDAERELSLYFPSCVITGDMPDGTNPGVLPATLTLSAENGTIAAATFQPGTGSTGNTQQTVVPFGIALLNDEDASAL